MMLLVDWRHSVLVHVECSTVSMKIMRVLSLRKYLIGFALLFLSEIGFGLTFVIGSVLTKRCGVSADVLSFVPTVWPQDLRAWLLLVALALVSTLMPFWTWNAAQRYLPLSVISVSAYFAPVIAMALGVLLLGETVTGLQWLGTLFIILSATAETNRQRHDHDRAAK